MRRTIDLRRVQVLLVLALTSWGCSSVHYSRPAAKSRAPGAPSHARGSGPPPHAPAHGYRAKTVDDVEIVFDASLGVYLVAGMKGHYYYEGVYYRDRDGQWSLSAHLEGPWEATGKEKLPPGLRSKKKPKGKALGHS